MEIQWSLVLFTVLAGAGSWMFVGAAVSEFTDRGKEASFLTSIIAIVLIIAGGLCSVTHLSHPTRMLGAISHPTSGIAIEAFMLGFACLAIIVYLVLLKRSSSDKARKVVAVVGAVLGIAFSFLMGESYMMAARANWNSVVVPLEYAVTSMVLGVSLYLLLLACRKEKEAVAFYGLPLAVAGAISLIVGLVYGFFSGVTAEAMQFWGCVVVLGTIVPIVCGAVSMKKADAALALMLCSSVGALVGSVVFRMLMWTSGTGMYVFFNALS